MLLNTGEEVCESQHGLVSTIAWGLDDQVIYALEGSVFIAGLATGFWNDKEELKGKARIDRSFQPQMAEKLKEKYYQGWQKAVRRVMD